MAARLGAKARFVGAIGRDAHGDRLVASMRQAGVDTSGVVRVPNRTGVTFVRVGLDGARSFLFNRHGGADFALSATDLEQLATPPLEGASWLHVMSSALVVEPLAGAARTVLAWAEQRGVPISLDLNVRAHLWADTGRMMDEVRRLASQAVLIKASEEDLHALGWRRRSAGLRSLMVRDGGLGVLTLAERGAVAGVNDTEVSVPAPVVDVVDATGAGDAFVAAMLVGLERRAVRPGVQAGWGDAAAWREVLAFACRVGSMAVTELGATDGVRVGRGVSAV